MAACQSPATPESRGRGQELRSGQYGSSGGSTGYGGSYSTSGYSGTSYGGSYSTSGYSGTSYGGSYSTSGYSGTSYGGSYSTSGYSGTSYGGSYSSSGYGNTWDPSTGYGGSYSTSGYGGTWNSSTNSGGSFSTGGVGGVGSDGEGSYTTSPTDTDSTTGTGTATASGGNVWHGIPSGTFQTGFVSEAYDNSACSGQTEEGQELLSTCEGDLTLEYPSHDTCTMSPESDSKSCDTWCYEAGLGGGVCTIESDGPDHCDCERRSDVGVQPTEAGCVAEYAASDKTCDRAPVNHVVATCGPIEAPRFVPNVLQDKRLEDATCSEEAIVEVSIDCDSYCAENSADPDAMVVGYCETEVANDCGGWEAAKCTCALLEYAATRTPSGLACNQVFYHPDRCDNDLPTSVNQPSGCGPGEHLTTFAATACTTDEIVAEFVDCEKLTCPEGKDGVCVEGVNATCPNGKVVEAAECRCV